MVGTSPTPVVWPKMNIAIVDVLVGTNALIALDVVLTSPTALATDADEVIFVERANQLACLSEPFLKGRKCLLAESTRLIAYLPRHDGRVILVLFLRITIGSGKDKSHIVVEQLVRLLTRSILRYEIHEGRITILIRTRSLAHTSVL